MRRKLEPILAFAAMTTLALGCGLQLSPSAGVGGSESTGAGGSDGPNAASAAGSGGGVSESSDTAPPSKAGAGGADLADCVVTGELSSPIYLSIPRARAMVSAAQVRGVLEAAEATIPLPSTIRGPELLNYYHIDYPLQTATELTVVPQLVPTEIPGQLLLQIGVQAPPADPAHRQRTSLTVLVDTSKSMEGESMKRANAAVLALAKSLNAGDVLNLVTTNSDTPPVHRVAAIAGDPAVFEAGPPLAVSGDGAVAVGIERAYEAAGAEDTYVTEGLNRVVVITDGGGPADSIDTSSVRDHWVKQRIQLVGVGVGAAQSYHGALLEAATTAGHGANLYLDSVAEADAMLHQRFGEIMDQAAGDLTLGFQLPTIFEVVNSEANGVTVGESQLTASDLGRGRSMVFRHDVSVCANADTTQLDAAKMTVTLTWSDPAFTDRQTRTFTFDLSAVRIDKPSYPMLKTSAINAFASALQSLQVSRFQEACAKIHAAEALIPQPTPNTPAVDPELASIRAQINAHPVMTKQQMTCK